MHLKVATTFCPPFSYWNGSCEFDTRHTNNKTCRGIPDGVENIVFDIVANLLGFTYSLENTFVSANDNPFRELLMMPANGLADLAYCGLWLVDFDARSEMLESVPLWNQLCVSFLVPEPQKIMSWRNILRPFTTSTWISIVVVTMMFSVIAFKLLRFELVYIMRKEEIADKYSFTSFVMNAFGTCLGISMKRNEAKEISNATKILAFIWFFSTLVITSFFTMNLASFLTLPFFEPKIDTIEDLIRNNFSWGVNTNNLVIRDVLDMHTEAGRTFATKFRIEKDLVTMIKSRKFAFPVITYENYFKQFDIGSLNMSIFKDMRLMKQKQSCYYSAFYFPKNSPLTEVFSQKILRIFEVGLLNHIMYDVFSRHSAGMKIITEKKYHEGATEALGIENLLGPFTVLTAGWSLSSLIFVLEKIVACPWIKKLFAK